MTSKNRASRTQRRFADFAIHEKATCNICIHGLLVYNSSICEIRLSRLEIVSTTTSYPQFELIETR